MTHPPEEWHYGRRVPENVRTDDDPSSHGSCVASKATGVVNGVSKRSHLVMLKIDNTAPNVIWGFATALDDIVAKNRQGRAVIAYPNTAISPSTPGFPPYPWSYAYSYMQDLFRNDVPVVVPSGNFALERVDRWTLCQLLWSETLTQNFLSSSPDPSTITGHLQTFPKAQTMLLLGLLG